MEEQGPSFGTYQPGNGHARAVCSQVGDTLAMMHGIEGAAAVKLAPAFAQAPYRLLMQQEADGTTLRVDGKLLDFSAVVGFNQKLRWASRHVQLIVAPGDDSRFSDRTELRRGRRPLAWSEDDAL